MPLDGHLYLVNQGWRGNGAGLRDGAITKPLAIPQKKNLAGLGKDREEAFPFWDHLFTAAAKSIQVKCLSDSDGEEDAGNSSATVSLGRTTTGILSNRRPIEGTPATSDASTPNSNSGSNTPRTSLLATAKRDAAKRSLYSRFFRGPVLGPQPSVEGTLKGSPNADVSSTIADAESVANVALKRRRNSKEMDDATKRERKKRQRDKDKPEEVKASRPELDVKESSCNKTWKKKRRKIREV